jgi:hypothetical protein
MNSFTPVGLRTRRLGLASCLVAVIAASSAVAPASMASMPATALTQGQLKTYAKSVKHPVYWIGPRTGYTYEVTQTANGRIYVRYLPPGVKAGDKRASFVVVATYPLKNAYAATQAAAQRLNAVPVTLGTSTGFAVSSATSFYLAAPQSNYQVELYAPAKGRAQELAVAGMVAPVL